MPAKINELEFTDNSLNILLKYEQKDDFDDISLCIIDTNEPCKKLTVQIGTEVSNNISFNENIIKYGEQYSFYIQTDGCNYSCSAKSNNMTNRTSISFLGILFLM